MIQKQPYIKPDMAVVYLNTIQMMAASGDPEVRTSSTKVDPNTEALTKESTSIWDEEW